MQTYVVIIEYQDLPENGGRVYGAFAPDAPMCAVTGGNLEQTLERVRYSLLRLFDAMRREGREPPPARSLAEHEREYAADGERLLGANSIVAMVDVPDLRRRNARAA